MGRKRLFLLLFLLNCFLVYLLYMKCPLYDYVCVSVCVCVLCACAYVCGFESFKNGNTWWVVFVLFIFYLLCFLSQSWHDMKVLYGGREGEG
ncbi:hypothetical protein F4775DRAFT_545712 [Biscogniauxia sp. FL1348]|nr:hypothetical protein F4775DRAFT_545712 [Biscogniauxia sp. FL1348]